MNRSRLDGAILLLIIVLSALIISTVNATPVNSLDVIINPQTGTFIKGQNMTLKAEVSGGTSPYSYQWYNLTNGTVTKMVGNTSSILVVPLTYGGATLKYMVSVTDSASTTKNSIGTYTINYPPAPSGGVPASSQPVITPPSTTTNITTNVTVNITKPRINVTHITIPPANITAVVASNISNKKALIVNFTNLHLTVNISTSSLTSLPATVKIINITSTAPIAPTNYIILGAENIIVNTTANVSIYVTQHYPCNMYEPSIAPFVYLNASWSKIVPFVINSSACTLSFSIPNDPIAGILEVPSTTISSNTTNATKSSNIITPPTTNITNTIVVPTTPTPTSTSTSSSNNTLIIGIIILVIIIAIIYYYTKKRKNKASSNAPPTPNKEA
ncbi:MAG: hypothetical protein ACP5T6_01130 [Candidatus Micrarchaeia archaeon]